MTYNPYLYLPRFASMNVLADADPLAAVYVLYEAYVYAGACTASAWLANGKPCSRDEAIAATMGEALPYTEQMPFPVSDAQRLVERGFDWLLQFDLAADSEYQTMEQS